MLLQSPWLSIQGVPRHEPPPHIREMRERWHALGRALLDTAPGRLVVWCLDRLSSILNKISR